MMVRRIFTWSVCFIVLWSLQAVFSPIKIFDVGPEYVLSGVVMLAMVENEKFAAIYGLIFGLICDISASAFFGAKALLFMFTGYFIGILRRKDIARNFISAGVFTVIPFTVGELLSFLSYTLRVGFDISFILYVFLPKFVLTIPVAVAVYFIFRHLYNRILKKEGLSGVSW